MEETIVGGNVESRTRRLSPIYAEDRQYNGDSHKYIYEETTGNILSMKTV